MLNASIVDVMVHHPQDLSFRTEVFVFLDVSFKMLEVQLPSLGGVPPWELPLTEGGCLAKVKPPHLGSLYPQVGQLRRDVLASELPVDSPKAFVETAVQPNFSVLCPSLPWALPMHFMHVNSSKSVPGEPDLCQVGIVLRAFHAFCLLTLRTQLSEISTVVAVLTLPWRPRQVKLLIQGHIKPASAQLSSKPKACFGACSCPGPPHHHTPNL